GWGGRGRGRGGGGVSEDRPEVAERMERITLVRSMTSKEGEHGLATYFAHAGYPSRGPIQYPTLGALVAKEAGAEDAELPGFVSVAPFRTFSSAAHGPGFLGPRFAPLVVAAPGTAYLRPAGSDAGDKALRVANLEPPTGVGREQFEARLRLVQEMQRQFVADHPGAVPQGHATACERAAPLMRTSPATAC